MYKVDTEQKDRQTLKDLMSKEHDQVNLEQFAYARLALLDLIDNEIPNEKDKERLAAIAEKLTEPDLEPLQAKIDGAIYELTFEGAFKGTPPQQAFVDARKGNLDLNKLVSRKADNKLLTNYLIVNKGMPVSRELRNSLHTKGHDELVSLIDKLQATTTQEQNHKHQEQQKLKVKTLGLKM